MNGNPGRADARQELAKGRIEVRVREESLSSKLN